MLGELDLEAAAKAAAGNWRKFQCFAWHRANSMTPTTGPSSTAKSGLRPFGSEQRRRNRSGDGAVPGRRSDVVAEHHHHWACGWVDGYSIRVFRRGRITKAFRTYHALAERLADYPILDESDYSRREYEATLDNLPDAAWKLKREYDLPEGWEEATCMAGCRTTTLRPWKTRDDQGGYPSEDQLRAAFEALGLSGPTRVNARVGRGREALAARDTESLKETT